MFIRLVVELTEVAVVREDVVGEQGSAEWKLVPILAGALRGMPSRGIGR